MSVQLSADDVRLALDHASDGVLIEKHDTIVYMNPRYAAILGYRHPGELIGASLRDLAFPTDRDLLLEFTRLREQGKPAPFHYTFRMCHRDGSAIALSASVSAAHRGEETFITTIVRETRLEKSLPLDELTLAQWNRLATRELEVVQLLLAGKRPKEIALELDISEKTVATHRSRAMAKLNVRDDLTLFRFAVRHGLVEL